MSKTMELFDRLQVVLAELGDAIEEEAPDGGAELLMEDAQALSRELKGRLNSVEEKGGLE